MKRLTHRPLRFESGPNLTPLVDVVLVVLIFMMLAGSFGSSSHFLSGQFALARASGRTAAATSAVPPVAIDLYLDYSSGGLVVRGASQQAAGDVSTMERSLIAKAEAFKSAGTNPRDVPVILHASRQVRYSDLMSVYEAAARADFRSIAFAVGKRVN